MAWASIRSPLTTMGTAGGQPTVAAARILPSLSATGTVSMGESMASLGEYTRWHGAGQALAYERLCEDEKLMVVINPNGKSASFDYAGTLGQPVYTVGGTAVQENGRIIAAPVSAGIYKI